MFDQYNQSNVQASRNASIQSLTKTIAGLAIVFTVSLGLCGLTALASNSIKGGGFLIAFGIFELVAMCGSGIGLVILVPLLAGDADNESRAAA